MEQLQFLTVIGGLSQLRWTSCRCVSTFRSNKEVRLEPIHYITKPEYTLY